jgi:hypothetical protein
MKLERNTLLNAVFSDSESDLAFRDSTLNLMLSRVRRYRRVRMTRRVSVLMLVGLGFIWMFRPEIPPTSLRVVKTVAGNYASIATHTGATSLIKTTPRRYAEVATAVSKVEFRTPLVGDQELLALTSPRSAILVRLGTDSQRLIFVDR